jgi:hypothetical protein
VKLQNGQCAQIFCSECIDEGTKPDETPGLKAHVHQDEDGDPSVGLRCKKHDCNVATVYIHPESFKGLMKSKMLDAETPTTYNWTVDSPPEVM